MHYVIPILVVIGILAVPAGLVWLALNYDRHPWVKKFLDAEARTVPGLYTDSDGQPLPKEYTDQIPGGWDNP
jgi:hypothetical protein